MESSFVETLNLQPSAVATGNATLPQVTTSATRPVNSLAIGYLPPIGDYSAAQRSHPQVMTPDDASTRDCRNLKNIALPPHSNSVTCFSTATTGMWRTEGESRFF